MMLVKMQFDTREHLGSDMYILTKSRPGVRTKTSCWLLGLFRSLVADMANVVVEILPHGGESAGKAEGPDAYQPGYSVRSHPPAAAITASTVG